jgi:hypothetical protein
MARMGTQYDEDWDVNIWQDKDEDREAWNWRGLRNEMALKNVQEEVYLL